MLVLSPVVVLDFLVYARELSREGPSIRQLGAGFALAGLFILVMVFLQVFTTIYDYARPIGPLFRDRFWLVYLLAGLGLAAPLLWGRRREVDPAGRGAQHAVLLREAGPERAGMFVFRGAATLGILTGVALLLTAGHPLQVPASSGALRVMTYNIQQGFDRVGNTALPDQLAAIRRVQPDVLAVEESDTARVANGNTDAVRYFADHLGMYSYYGPTTTAGTFGIALLSKYPILKAATFYLYSAREQTACIQAIIEANGVSYNVFVTHLGNGGPMVQLVDVLNRVDGAPNVILMGDFNFDPSTPQYTLATRILADAWLERWPDGRQLPGPGGEGRIDLILVSPSAEVIDAEYVPDPASDHPYLFAVIR
jgi:endonuclease/exonuclease/phosphatase family metal-dependent hydrolase